MVDGERFVRVLLVADHGQSETLGNLFENPLGLLGLLEQLRNLRKRRYLDAQFPAEQYRQLVDQIEIARIGQSDLERPVLGVDRHEIVAEHQIDRDGVEQVVIDVGYLQVDEFVIVALGQRAGPRDLLGRVLRKDLVGGRHVQDRMESAKEKIG